MSSGNNDSWHEKRTNDLIQKLTFALEANDQIAIDSMDIEHNKIDFTHIRAPLLKKLDKLYNHENYGKEYSFC